MVETALPMASKLASDMISSFDFSRCFDTALISHFLISEENELALFWYLSGEFVDQTRAGFRVVKSGVG